MKKLRTVYCYNEFWLLRQLIKDQLQAAYEIYLAEIEARIFIDLKYFWHYIRRNNCTSRVPKLCSTLSRRGYKESSRHNIHLCKFSEVYQRQANHHVTSSPDRQTAWILYLSVWAPAAEAFTHHQRFANMSSLVIHLLLPTLLV